MPNNDAEVHGELMLSQVVMKAKPCPGCATTNAWNAAACTECGAELTEVHGGQEDLGVTTREEF